MVKSEILEKIRDIYTHNVFTHRTCGIEIRDIACGWSKLGIIMDKERHANLKILFMVG